VQRDLVWKQDRMVGLLDSLLARLALGSRPSVSAWLMLASSSWPTWTAASRSRSRRALRWTAGAMRDEVDRQVTRFRAVGEADDAVPGATVPANPEIPRFHRAGMASLR